MENIYIYIYIYMHNIYVNICNTYTIYIYINYSNINIYYIYIYIYIYVSIQYIYIYIYICMYIYENNRMKIKDRVLRFTHKRFRWCCFPSVCKGCHFDLLIWRCLVVKYELDVILRTRYFRRSSDLSLFIEQRFESIYEIIFIKVS